MHTNIHCTDSSQVGGGGCWVGSHIGSHDKMHTQDIIYIIYYNIYCALFAHVLYMHDGPRDHAQEIGPYCYTYTCGEGEWVVGL